MALDLTFFGPVVLEVAKDAAKRFVAIVAVKIATVSLDWLSKKLNLDSTGARP